MTMTCRWLLVPAACCLLAAAPAAPIKRLAPPPSFQARVTLLADGEFFERLVETVAAARREVLVSTYIFITRGRDGNRADILARKLAEAAGRGVRVKVRLEEDKGDRELTEQNRKTARLLEQGGVTVIFDDPSVKSHGKVAVVDGRWVFIGSHNLSDSALSYNREMSVVIDSPEAATAVDAWMESPSAR